jgi:hypothetical protein
MNQGSAPESLGWRFPYALIIETPVLLLEVGAVVGHW